MFSFRPIVQKTQRKSVECCVSNMKVLKMFLLFFAHSKGSRHDGQTGLVLLCRAFKKNYTTVAASRLQKNKRNKLSNGSGLS